MCKQAIQLLLTWVNGKPRTTVRFYYTSEILDHMMAPGSSLGSVPFLSFR